MIIITPKYVFTSGEATIKNIAEKFAQIGNDISVRDAYLGLTIALRYVSCKQHPMWQTNEIEIYHSADGVFREKGVRVEYKGFCCDNFREEVRHDIGELFKE